VKRKINPNRMMLLRMKRRLELAVRGHKLLKNKQEKLMQNFFSLVRETTDLRNLVEREFLAIAAHYQAGRSMTDRQSLADALSLTVSEGTLEIEERYEMSILIPEFSFTLPEAEPAYTMRTTGIDLDGAFSGLYRYFPELVKLAGKENALFRMAEELEKTRRRVNALEYVLIPDLEETIRSIESKLSEAERGTQTRLMKIKDMVQSRESGV
jgi:V/A-type H+-transporting ATPase subunit D